MVVLFGDYITIRILESVFECDLMWGFLKKKLFTSQPLNNFVFWLMFLFKLE